MDGSEIVIRLSSQPRNFCAVRAAAEAAALAWQVDEDSAGQVKLAVTEALANVTKHGYKGRTDRPICVRLAPEQRHGHPGLVITIEDECEDVDLGAIKSRPLDEIRPGGLGVHIIHQTMDEVEYTINPCGTGVRLRMCKFSRTPERNDHQ